VTAKFRFKKVAIVLIASLTFGGIMLGCGGNIKSEKDSAKTGQPVKKTADGSAGGDTDGSGGG